MTAKAPLRRRRKMKRLPKNLNEIILKALDYSDEGIILGNLEGTVYYHNKAWLRIHALDENLDLRGKNVREYERPELLPILEKFNEALMKRGSYTYQFGTVRRDGKYHDVHLSGNIIRELDPPVAVAILREVTDLVQTQKEVARRNVEFALLNEMHQVIARARDRKIVMRQMLKLLGGFIGAKSGIVYLVDHSKDNYVVFQSVGVSPAILKRIDRIPLSDPGFKLIMKSRHAVVMEEDTKIQPPKGAEVRPETGIKRVIGFAFKTGTKNAYLVVFGLAEAETVDPGVRSFLDTASRQFGIAVERLELLDVLRRSERELKELTKRLIDAGEEERRKCSIMLHDEVGQALTALKLELEALENGLGPLDSCTRKSLEGIRKQVKFVAESTRTIAKSFHPAMLDELGFVPTLNWYIDNFVRGEKLDVEFEDAGFDEDVPAAVSLALYRVAQEALTNVVRHARASRVSISLTKGYPCVIMEIEDNGRGISKQEAKTKTRGLGLVSMRERIEYMGGTFRIRSSRGKGTKVRVKIPIGADHG
jgi:PAS domain S-box-containing protein